MLARSILPCCFAAFCLLPVTLVAQVTLQKNDHICLIGNALGEGLQHQNTWETLLHQRFPALELTVRNLCFPGDEPVTRIRSENFGDPDTHLKHSGATVVAMFFGFNESFAGDSGLPKFSADMTRLVEETKQKSYSPSGRPRIVLVSPIAFEDTGDVNMLRGDEPNARLEKYTAALEAVAKSTGVAFVDVFHPTKKLFEESQERFTMNGAHLNAVGYAAFGKILDEQMFGTHPNSAIDTSLKKLVDDKNFHWWHRYRAVNGYSIYGTRGEAGSDGTYRNREVMEREREILDQMTANRDRHIWAKAAGKPIASPVDDNNTLPFIVPKTNVGIKDDPNIKNGKLGSLEYLTAEEQKKKFKLAPGYEINLVASEEQFPELANPVALNFDNRGRLWVATMPSYPHWQPKTPMDDRLLILEDTNQDGLADVCKVFAGGLHQPTGFELGYGGVFVAQQPDILFIQDTDGDDREDFRERRLVGFDSADSHHGLAAFRWGPDGGLYFQEGTFKYSQVESPNGLQRLAEAGIWRYEPRTGHFSVHASFAFANPWGHVFDRWGQDFIGDASPGFSYWAAPISGRISYPMKHPGGSQHKRVAKLIGGDPDYQFPTFYPKRTRPLAGCEIVSSRNFPPDVQGNWLVTNCIGDRAVLNHTIQEQGSGFEGKEVPAIISCDDGNFRPVDAQFAPDGSLYVVDWHNALIGHLQHNLREPNRDHSHGRIWRITYKDRPLVTPAKIAGEPLPTLLNLLASPENNTRYRARREIAERPSQAVLQATKSWLSALDKQSEDYEQLLLEGLWVYQTHNVVERDLLTTLLNAKNHRARAAAVRALAFWFDRLASPLELIKPRVNDEHPMVRLEAVRALSFASGDEAASLAMDALSHEADDMIRYTLNETLRTLAPTRVFLDKPSLIVEYQLARLSTKELLQAARDVEGMASLPIHQAILTRNSMTTEQRQSALDALAKLNQSNPAKELLSVLSSMSANNKQETDTSRRMAEQLTHMLVAIPSNLLAEQNEALVAASQSKASFVRRAGFAGLISLGQGLKYLPVGQAADAATMDWLAAIPMAANDSERNQLRTQVIQILRDSKNVSLKRQAILSLSSIKTNAHDTFLQVSKLVKNNGLRAAAVTTLSALPTEAAGTASDELVNTLLTYAEGLKPADRTSDECIQAMQLVNSLLPQLTTVDVASYRSRLKSVSVQVVHLKTVEEQMRYDLPYFAVEAGRPVQIVLDNEDIMPHNLVITAHGALREVAEEGAAVGPDGGWQKKPYVPRSNKVLFATGMVPAFAKEKLTFTAPKEPGEYPYVCTFPQHWLRMYGVMVVVPDLEAWHKQPVLPKDPIGSNRTLVKNWTLEDFQDKLESGLRGRSLEIGKKLFTEATCASCHKVQGQGGVIGPELTDIVAKWKGDRLAVLREIIEPSHKIDDKYAMHLVLTVEGQTLSGIVVAEDKEAVTLLSSQEAKAPTVISRDDIEQMNKSKISMMPKGLLDQYTPDEIFEILAYLESIGTKP